MNKRIDFTQTGGFPLDQDVLKFMQESYRDALSAIAKMAGDRVIICGCELYTDDQQSGSTNQFISSGWIAVNGELMQFEGGEFFPFVVIYETQSPLQFEDGQNKNVVFERKASVGGLTGDFEFSELRRMSELVNVWLPGDIKNRIVASDYAASKFDLAGIGKEEMIGWKLNNTTAPDVSNKVTITIEKL